MVNAEYTTKRGTKIRLDGSPQEIAEFIEEFEKKERREEERLAFFEKMRERNKMVHGSRHASISITSILNGYADKGFFDTPRLIGEVMIKLREEGIAVPSTTIHPILGRLVTMNKLKRERNEKGVWQYSKMKEAKK